MPETLHPGVYVQEVSEGPRVIELVSTSTAAFIGVAERGPVNKPVFITNYSQFRMVFGSFIEEGYLAYSVKHFFDNGGKRCYIVRVTNGTEVTATADIPADTIDMTVDAVSPGSWGSKISVGIEAGSSEPYAAPAISETIKIKVYYDGTDPKNVVETFDNLPNPASVADTASREEIIAAINGISYYVKIRESVTFDQFAVIAAATTPPAVAIGPVALAVPPPPPDPDGIPPADSDYTGNESQGTGLYALDELEDANIIAIPAVTSSTVINAALSYCENRRFSFFVADMPLLITDPVQARDFAANDVTMHNSYGAIYYPWVEASDPIGKASPTKKLPPSGFVAGVYARTDNTRGVFKAPAGIEASLAGSTGLTYKASDADQDLLNPNSVNVIRFFSDSGTVIWGARTLHTNTLYRYVPIRRFAIALEQSILNGTQFAVFEPNDEPLWSTLRLTIGALMQRLFLAGAFQGDTPDKAYFVKCDAETNPQPEIDAGRVNIVVGFAPLKPAEFVILRISQKTASAES